MSALDSEDDVDTQSSENINNANPPPSDAISAATPIVTNRHDDDDDEFDLRDAARLTPPPSRTAT